VLGSRWLRRSYPAFMGANLEEIAKALGGATINQKHGVTILAGAPKLAAGVKDKATRKGKPKT